MGDTKPTIEDLDFDLEDDYDDDYYDEYDPYNDPDWEPPCPCWCEMCGCHGDCYDWDDDEDTTDALDD